MPVFGLDLDEQQQSCHGDRVLRFEAIAHNTAELRCGRMIETFPEIVTQLAGIAQRFATAPDCVNTGFLGDGTLDERPAGSTLGATRIGGVDLNTKRMRDAPFGGYSPCLRHRTASPSASSPPRCTPSPGTTTPDTASPSGI